MAVAHFAGALDLDGELGEGFDEVFANESRVPTRAAGHQDQTPDFREGLAVQGGLRKGDGTVFRPQGKAEGIGDAIGLLKDFLEHVVGEFAAFGRFGGPVDGGGVAVDGFAAGGNGHGFAINADDVTILKVEDFASVRGDG